ncbi:MAG TPA: AAA family ATPase [Bacteroidales bacterium]|nr:AAA family ATPase [Bacteroidales bacterium]HCI54782.1 hypothetical protein [Bacteroidales bacterium]HQG52754.1 AAA family ATPase [Bacteroidales bacterium]HRC90255.1 AAA family ATPase [Bacteroidales bacterium]
MDKEETTPELLARQERAVVVAPAGCGKTHIIAESIKYTEGRQLILTHTHAGVHSIRNKLIKLQIPSNKYRVETIAGFALRYASSYPKICGYDLFNDDQIVIYDNLYSAAENVIRTIFGRKIINSTYSGLFVDEYQDCTIDQHKLILTLSEILPTRILGDPLQGIFEFTKNQVNWNKDIFQFYIQLPDLTTPWRWKNNNSDLGAWLFDIRHNIESNENIYLSKLPSNTKWFINEWRNQINQLFYSKGDTVGIIDIDNRAHKIASCLKGNYNSMEEMERRTLFKFINKFEKSSRKEKILEIFSIASKCITKIKNELKPIRICLERDKRYNGKNETLKSFYFLIDNYLRTGNNILILELIRLVSSFENSNIYRKELWMDIEKIFSSSVLNPEESLKNIARKYLETYSIIGRKVYRKTISRPHLIKGLEFNHAILLDADALKPKELYVSLTRGSNYLTILSKQRVLTPKN